MTDRMTTLEGLKWRQELLGRVVATTPLSERSELVAAAQFLAQRIAEETDREENS